LITIGIQSDSAETPTNDYFVYDFIVDWTGWKELSIPFKDFSSLGRPVGWSKVDAILFYSKSKWQNPDPRTILYLDDLRLLATEPPITASTHAVDGLALKENIHRVPVKLNHGLPEVTHQLQNDEPEVHTYYFNAARGRYGYYPQYDPGYVSFDPTGKAYIHSKALIETLNHQGKWVRMGLQATLEGYAKQNGWKGISIRKGEEPIIRFDQEGDLYVLETITRLDEEGKELHDAGILLHSRDQGRNWTIYPLPHPLADFEKLDAHNQDCLKNPPAIILSDIKWRHGSDQSNYLLLPKKQADGTLQLPSEILISNNALMGPVHSGSGNFIVSKEDKVFVVYGMVPLSAKDYSGAAFDEATEKANQMWLKTLPPVPADHPARSMAFAALGPKPEGKAAEGVPSFIVVYDRKTGHLSKPVFLGYGGRSIDDHNWPAIAMDSKGILHVVINGHCAPLLYTHSLKPLDITAWSMPVYIPYEPDSDKFSYVSYASLNCDKQDNLLCVVRSDSRAYNHRIASLRKPAGEPWGKERSIVVPFSDKYHVWTHKVTYDRHSNRFFLSFYDQSSALQMSRDTYLFYRFIWPAGEIEMADRAKLTKSSFSGLPQQGADGMFVPGPSEMTVLVSENGGKSWKFATTPDFLKNR
jgi:hypothetical protein